MIKRDTAARDLSSEHHTGRVLLSFIRKRTAPTGPAAKARWKEGTASPDRRPTGSIAGVCLARRARCTAR